MTMSVLSGDSSFSACFFLCFLALFYSVLCLNSGTKPKLGLALCFLPFVFVFFPFLCFVRSPAFSCSHPPIFLFSVALPLSVLLLSFSLSPAFFFFSSPRFCSFFPFSPFLLCEFTLFFVLFSPVFFASPFASALLCLL